MTVNRKKVVIVPKQGWLDFNLKELFEYRDLVWMFVKRNMAIYKQTILGPAWIVLKPLITSFMFTLVYANMLGISTDGLPAVLFYMSGNIIWSYFSVCVTEISTTFVTNSNIFSKVYFPRLTTPVSTVIFQGFSFFVQLVVFVAMEIIYLFTTDLLHPNIWLLAIPLVIIEVAVLGLSVGLILASVTIKYRDLQVFATFGIQLFMYITPVIYSTNKFSLKIRNILLLNPIAPIIETFRYAFFGVGEAPWFFLIISVVVTIILLILSLMLFSHSEKTVVDVV